MLIALAAHRCEQGRRRGVPRVRHHGVLVRRLALLHGPDPAQTRRGRQVAERYAVAASTAALTAAAIVASMSASVCARLGKSVS